MQFPYRLTSPLSSSTFADYDTAAPAVRGILGVSRLSPRLAAEIRAAVAKHEARRQARTPDPLADPMARLQERVRREATVAVSAAFRGEYRVFESTLRVEIAHVPSVRVGLSTKWVSGRGGFGHVTDGQTTHLNVMPAWRREVQGRGLAVVGGLLTTHLYPVHSEGGITVYRAAWVRQGRGYDLHAETGYLADQDGDDHAFHVAAPWGDGKAIDRAIKGLRRQIKAQALPAAERDAAKAARARKAAERKANQFARFLARLARYDLADIAHVVVTRADSLRAGNCVPGTDAFIARVGLGRDEATIGEIAEAIGRTNLATLAAADVTLARQFGAAVLQAVRRDRSARRMIGV